MKSNALSNEVQRRMSSAEVRRLRADDDSQFVRRFDMVSKESLTTSKGADDGCNEQY
jgi:hypothetical protein